MERQEQFAVISGVPTEELKETIIQISFEGWSVAEQIYRGENLWELVLVR